MKTRLYRVAVEAKPTAAHPAALNGKLFVIFIFLFSEAGEDARDQAFKIIDSLPYERTGPHVVAGGDFSGFGAAMCAAVADAWKYGIGLCFSPNPNSEGVDYFSQFSPTVDSPG